MVIILNHHSNTQYLCGTKLNLKYMFLARRFFLFCFWNGSREKWREQYVYGTLVWENARTNFPERHNNNVTPTHDSTSCRELKIQECRPINHRNVRNWRKTPTLLGYETAKTRKITQNTNYHMKGWHIWPNRMHDQTIHKKWHVLRYLP